MSTARKVRELDAIDELRAAVRLFGACRETFNQQLSARQLLILARVVRACEWDILPDEWTRRQQQQASRGWVPQWKEDERGRLVPVFEGLTKIKEVRL